MMDCMKNYLTTWNNNVHNTHSLQWLSMDSSAEYDRYRQYWESSSYQRPHDHPGYLSLMRPAGYSASVVLYQYAENARITYPFFHCDLTKLAPFRHIDRSLRHLISPYGYGGALYEGNPEQKEAASEAFEYLFSREMRERSFVSEFVREDLFSSRLARRSAGEVEDRPNVAVRLDRTPEAIWNGYTHAVKGNIKRAQKEGLRAVFDRCGDQLDHFLHVYYETMKRRQAADEFYIPRQRFEDLKSTLGSHGGTLYAHIYDGDEVVSTELLLLAHDTMYSFLGGSLAHAFKKRPNNLLKHEAILWGARNGYKWLVLGGGLSANDELLRFKQSFDPESSFPFRLRKIIHNQAAYDFLAEARTSYEKERQSGWEPKPGFFPVYLS